MKKTIIPYLFLVFINSYLCAQTQKAELFFNDGTSIEGYAKLTKNNKIKFRISLKHETDTWTNLMVKNIIIQEDGFGVKYEYINIFPNRSAKLLKVLAEGKVNLYASIKIIKSAVHSNFQNGIPTNIIYGEGEKVKYYVKKENKEYPTLLSGFMSFRRNAKKYFSDCIGIIDKLDTREFDTHNSSEMVNYYNDFCSE